MAASKIHRAKSKRKYAQGGQLPINRSPLALYPVGCCVSIERPMAGYARWHLVAFRIGGVGSPHCRSMSKDPSDPDWNGRMGDACEISGDTVVYESAWPARRTATTDVGIEEDPILGNVDVSHRKLL